MLNGIRSTTPWNNFLYDPIRYDHFLETICKSLVPMQTCVRKETESGVAIFCEWKMLKILPKTKVTINVIGATSTT